MSDDPENPTEPDEPDKEPASHEIPAAQEDRIVDKILSKVKEIVGPAGPGDARQPEREAASAPAGPAATERDMEAKVKEAVEKEITGKERRSAAAAAREAHEAEHAKLREAVERPPKIHSRLTTALWGGDDA